MAQTHSREGTGPGLSCCLHCKASSSSLATNPDPAPTSSRPGLLSLGSAGLCFPEQVQTQQKNLIVIRWHLDHKANYWD